MKTAYASPNRPGLVLSLANAIERPGSSSIGEPATSSSDLNVEGGPPCRTTDTRI
jgi:hypothetical protein